MSLLVDSRAVQDRIAFVLGWTNCTERFGVAAQPDAWQAANRKSKISNFVVELIKPGLTRIYKR